MNKRNIRQKDIIATILRLLSKQEMDIHAQSIIESVPEYSHNTILKYLAVLESEGRITSRSVGNAKLYRISSD